MRIWTQEKSLPLRLLSPAKEDKEENCESLAETPASAPLCSTSADKSFCAEKKRGGGVDRVPQSEGEKGRWGGISGV